MKLNEWQYINNTPKAPAEYFVNRFEKLMDYHSQHLPASVKSIENVSIESDPVMCEDSLWFRELHYNGDRVDYLIKIDTETLHWRVRSAANDDPYQIIATGNDWSELLKALRQFMTVPVTGTPEYKNLLTEWVEIKTNTSSGSFKKKFEKLIKYHIDHASSELESVTKKDIKDNGFRLSEHYNTSSGEFDRDIVVSYDKDSDTFMLRVFVYGKEVYNTLRNKYEDLVRALTPYLFLPGTDTQEYNDLLTESYSSITEDFKAYENLWD